MIRSMSTSQWLEVASSKRGLLAKREPATWIDAHGKTWPTPQATPLKFGSSRGYRALREFVRQRDKGLCAICGLDEKTLALGDLCHVADHIISRRNGGSHHPRNLQWLCNACNSRKVQLLDNRAEGGR